MQTVFEIWDCCFRRAWILKPSGLKRVQAGQELQGCAAHIPTLDRNRSPHSAEYTVTRFAKLNGYLWGSLELQPESSANPWPVSASVALGTDWSPASSLEELGFAKGEGQSLIPTFRTFDVGLPGSFTPVGNLSLKIRGFHAADSIVPLKLPLAGVRPENPSFVRGTFRAAAGGLSGRSLACAFTPSGFALSVPCPSVLIP